MKEEIHPLQDGVFKYSHPLSNAGLNCVGPFMCIITVLHDPQLVESVDAGPRRGRVTVKLHVDFRVCRGWAPLTPSLFKGQLYSCSLVSAREWLQGPPWIPKSEDAPVPYS